MAALSWLLYGSWSTASLRGTLRAALAEVSPGVLRVRAEAAMTVDVRHLLQQIRCPVLALHAGSDRLLGRRTRLQLKAGLPQSESIEMEGPHLLLQVATQRCADLVADFVGRCTRRT